MRPYYFWVGLLLVWFLVVWLMTDHPDYGMSRFKIFTRKRKKKPTPVLCWPHSRMFLGRGQMAVIDHKRCDVCLKHKLTT